MKIRDGFVSNSSSSSFIVTVARNNIEEFVKKINKLTTSEFLFIIETKSDIVKLMKKMEWYMEDDFMFVKDFNYDQSTDSIVFVPQVQEKINANIDSSLIAIKEEIEEYRLELDEFKESIKKTNDKNEIETLTHMIERINKIRLELIEDYKYMKNCKLLLTPYDIDALIAYDLDDVVKSVQKTYNALSELIKSDEVVAILNLRKEGGAPMSMVEEILSDYSSEEFVRVLREEEIPFISVIGDDIIEV